MPKYEARECATLGTYFRDIYKDGKLFAMEVPDNIAEWAIKNPHVFLGNVSAPVPKLRTWALENEFVAFGGRME